MWLMPTIYKKHLNFKLVLVFNLSFSQFMNMMNVIEVSWLFSFTVFRTKVEEESKEKERKQDRNSPKNKFR